MASVVTLTLLTTFGFSAQALTPAIASYAWELQRDHDGIRVYTSKVLNSDFLAVKGEMQVNGKVSFLVALVKDLACCPQWADLCKAARVVDEPSATEEIIYALSDAPFPVQDRDVVARALWQTDKSTGRAPMLTTAISLQDSAALIPVQKNTVRVVNANTEWHFTPVSDSVVLVETFAHIDPGGPIPAWMVNLVSVNSPFKSLQGMRKIIESGAYTNAELAF